jgi:hypothetical protein
VAVAAPVRRCWIRALCGFPSRCLGWWRSGWDSVKPGAFAGASGTIRAKAVNHAPTKRVITIIYSG